MDPGARIGRKRGEGVEFVGSCEKVMDMESMYINIDPSETPSKSAFVIKIISENTRQRGDSEEND